MEKFCNLSVIRIWTETNIYDKVMRGRKFCVFNIRIESMETLDAYGKKKIYGGNETHE